jgi:predicted DCC family thiol-disulfide oxidoreductase YuxK
MKMRLGLLFLFHSSTYTAAAAAAAAAAAFTSRPALRSKNCLFSSKTTLSSSTTLDSSISKDNLNSSSNSREESLNEEMTQALQEVDWDWKKLAKDVFAQGDARPIVLFDGVCNLCNGGVNFAMDQDEAGKLRFCSLQSKVGRSLLLQAGREPSDMSSIVLMTQDHAYFGSDAVSRICVKLDAVPLQMFGHLGQITPDFLRESIYNIVSENRYQLGGGEYDSCRMDYDGTLQSRFVQDPADNE